MTQYFVVVETNPYPMFGDKIMEYINASSASTAIDKMIDKIDHPCGIATVKVFKNGEEYFKKVIPLDQREFYNGKY